MRVIKNQLLGEQYYEIHHASGLTILVYPKPGFQSAYALFGTSFGSTDRSFTTRDGKHIALPDGTAHFLEHKLFESEEKDAFEKFAATGARANAYTSFDKTCYLFSCSENFYENLKMLLEFVGEPYFTEQTIAKEQGIIGQEIKMYRDNPEWQATMNLLGALYKNCAVNTDIAGSVESIAQITPEHLYSAYKGFYVPDNMVLSVCADVEVDKVLAVCDACLPKGGNGIAAVDIPREPETPRCDKTVNYMPVAMPLFAFGYKEHHEGLKSLREKLETVMLNQILIGTMSPLYERLMEQGLIGEDFASEYFTGRLYSAVLFTGSGENGEKVKALFEQEVERVKKEGIDPELFDCVLKDMYGTMIKGFNSVEDIASDMLECYMSGYGYFEELELFREITIEALEKRLLSKYESQKGAISLILPADERK